MTKQKIDKILKALKKEYPSAKTMLLHENPFQLLVATILSAQCTDERVNRVTPVLFAKYPAPKDFVKLKQETLEKIIYSTGFYKNKAKNIIESAKAIVNEFDGKVPDNMQELLTLKGVARKTANVVLNSAYGNVEGVVVDTHVKRLSYRLGLTKNTNPEKVERDLMKIIPKDYWSGFDFALISHGRKVCISQKPLCSKCALENLCPKNGVSKSA
jgi:endonuclease III